MAIGQLVETVDGYGEIVSETRSRFGSVQYRVIGEFGEGHYSAREILSDIEDHDDDDGTTTDINFHKQDDVEHHAEFPAEENTWLDGGTKLPWNPEPTEEWDGQLSKEFEDHDISLKDTNSLKGHDTHPDPEDHNSIWDGHARQASRHFRFSFDAEDTDYAEDEDYADREEGKTKESSIGPRQAFVDYISLIESNTLVKEAAWSDVRRKAKRLWQDGDVMVKSNNGREIFAKVDGDNGTYDVEVHRKNAFGQGITWYDCNCEWGKWAYKRERDYVGRLCSHGLATYYAMQAKTQPAKNVKMVDKKTERHSLATAPKATRVETESLAARQGGLMVWDDDLPKAMKAFFPQAPSPASLSADPGAGAGAPAAPAGDPAGTIGPDLSSELAQDTPAAPTFDGADSNFEPDPNPGTPITDKVRTAEFSKNPDTDDLFEDWAEPNSEDAETFNDTDKNFKKKDNDPEYAVYDEFWGRSSFVQADLQSELFKQGPNPKALMDIATEKNNTGIPEPGRKLLHFVRKQKTAADRKEVEGHTEQEIADMAAAFNLMGRPEEAEKFLDHRKKVTGANASDGDIDYSETGDEDHETNYQDDPNDGVNGNDNSYQGDDDDYQSEHWLDEDEAEWREFDPKNDDDGPFDKSSSFQNEAEADSFNDEADSIVQQFQRSAAAQGLFSDKQDDDSGAFMTVASDPQRRTAGRHFTYQEQEQLINEQGVARHIGELNLDGTFYLD